MALVFLDNENGFQSQPVRGYFFGGKGEGLMRTLLWRGMEKGLSLSLKE